MEGKTHTEWDPNNCMTEDDKIEGRKAGGKKGALP